MHGKYADVIGLDEAVRYIDTLPDGLFETIGVAARQAG
jgi:hypothetical protein